MRDRAHYKQLSVTLSEEAAGVGTQGGDEEGNGFHRRLLAREPTMSYLATANHKAPTIAGRGFMFSLCPAIGTRHHLILRR